MLGFGERQDESREALRSRPEGAGDGRGPGARG
jgi:hypothetical protein